MIEKSRVPKLRSRRRQGTLCVFKRVMAREANGIEMESLLVDSRAPRDSSTAHHGIPSQLDRQADDHGEANRADQSGAAPDRSGAPSQPPINCPAAMVRPTAKRTCPVTKNTASDARLLVRFITFVRGRREQIAPQQ